MTLGLVKARTLDRHDVVDRARRLLFNYVLGARRGLYDAAAIGRLAPLASPYVPWSDVAMRPAAVVTVLDEIAMFGRTRIVECGGGLSTIYIARLLRERGGRLTTIEQDPEWVELLREQLSHEALDDVVEIVHAPLEDADEPGAAPWYARAALDRVGADGIDLLLVDGPIAGSDHPQIRYAALPYFLERLDPGALIVLDDILRRGEREIVRRWRVEHGVAMEIRPLDGAIAVGRILT